MIETVRLGRHGSDCANDATSAINLQARSVTRECDTWSPFMELAHFNKPASDQYRDANGNPISREEWLLLIESRRNPFYRYPSDASQRIWRYMDFTKFVSLLDDETLFLPSAARFDDIFEGAVSNINAALIDKQIGERVRSLKTLGLDRVEDIRRQSEEFYQEQARRREWVRNWTYISCWHAKNYESAALWRLYSKSDDVVAIQSTFQRLFDCIRPHIRPPHGEPRIGLVSYYNLDEDIVRTNVHLSEFFYKLRAFEHEEELRVVMQELPLKPKGDGWVEDDTATPSGGKRLAVDVAHLVERVYVSPHAAEWIVDLTTRVVKRYGLDCPVLASALKGPAMFHSAFNI